MSGTASIVEARKIVGSLLRVRKMNSYDIAVTGSNLQFERLRKEVVNLFEAAGYAVDVRYTDAGTYILHVSRGA